MFVGDPMTRIREDYLRILRFFRFHAWYGRGDADQTALAACKALKGMVEGRAAERIQKELLKLLAADDPRAAAAADGGHRRAGGDPARREIAGPVRGPGRPSRPSSCSRTIAELRLAALIPDDPKVAEQMAERLRLSNALKERLVEAVGKSPRIVSWMSPREIRRAVYALGLKTFSDRVKLAWAGRRPARPPRRNGAACWPWAKAGRRRPSR